MIIKSTCMPVDRPNVDTDQIIPAGYLTTISKKGLGVHLFESVPDNPLLSGKFEEAKIILTRENFGCGSSREHAAWAIMDRGFDAVVASSFARIFEDNCYNNGIVPVRLSPEEIAEAFSMVLDNPQVETVIDVKAGTIRFGETEFTFTLDPLKNQFILEGGFLKYLDALVPEIREWDKTRVG